MGGVSGELTRSQKRAQRTLRSLLEAGEHVFGANGLQQVTIAEITDRADVALGSFYNYFENRDALLDAVLDEAFESQLKLSRIMLRDDTSPANRLTSAIASQIHRARLDPAWASFSDSAALGRRWPHEDWRTKALETIERGRALGVFEIDDVAWTAELVLALSRSIFDPVNRGRSWSLEDELTAVLNSLFRLVGAPADIADEEIAWAVAMPIDLDLVERVRSSESTT